MPARWPTAQYTDAGQAVLWNGAYTAYLPCKGGEPCKIVGPTGSFNQVRAADGVHFCPGTTDASGACSVWSSGAWRYGTALAAPVIAALGGDLAGTTH